MQTDTDNNPDSQYKPQFFYGYIHGLQIFAVPIEFPEGDQKQRRCRQGKILVARQNTEQKYKQNPDSTVEQVLARQEHIILLTGIGNFFIMHLCKRVREYVAFVSFIHLFHIFSRGICHNLLSLLFYFIRHRMRAKGSVVFKKIKKFCRKKKPAVSPQAPYMY
ncbi:MAG: hypothetical protein IJ480_08575 [Clostridia bacterium]|nr:hypothetical protein [Clostridia bacterium]